MFLYEKVLGQDIGTLPAVVRARRPTRLPVVMTRTEVKAVLDRLRGTPRLMASLLYGSGLRLMECVTLRVKDVDFGAGHLMVRRGKGARDRAALLPRAMIDPLQKHLHETRQLHERDVAAGAGFVELPDACE